MYKKDNDFSMKMKKIGTTIVVAVLVLAVLGAGGYYIWQKTGGGIEKDLNGDVKISDYSALFLTNGQVYFGKIYSRANGEVDIRDIYYLQVNQQIQPDQKGSTNNDQTNVVLVKLGDELHGPNDRMRVNKDQVLFTESLKQDSKVVKAIEDYQTTKK